MRTALSFSHKRLNNILIFVVLFLGIYILVLPFLPAFAYWFKKHNPPSQPAYVLAANDPNAEPEGIPSDNRLVLPQIFLDMPVLEGPDIETALQGLWRKPGSSTPDKGGNTVIVGHRFLYKRNTDSFYTLDKMKIGDNFALYWQGRAYHYKVSEIKIVNSTQNEIEAPTDSPRITLYTCTPLWTAENRLVVIGEPIKSVGETR